MNSMRRGEIRLCRFAPPDKRRPVLLLTRDEVLGQLREVIVAPITRTVRGLRSEVVLLAAASTKSPGLTPRFNTTCQH